jgi:ubiquinone biosynthesis protein UbiJ
VEVTMGFIQALSKYFGRREGQTLSEFQKEISALTHKDKLDLQSMLAGALGEPVDAPAPPK